jgi:hypothetical protein|tara:strand:- start:2229 stop:2723 length:495 start_codon:yes stop_codon:yes gene_type:complete
VLNKRAQVEDFLPLLILIILLVFFFLFISCTNVVKEVKEKEKVELQSVSKNSAQLLINFLRMPSVLDNTQDSNIADALSIYFLTEDPDILESVNRQAQEFFSSSELETDKSFWSLEIKYPDKKTIKLVSDKRRNYKTVKEISTITVQTNKPDKNIEMNLFISYT